jgi:general secretion pathway protein E
MMLELYTPGVKVKGVTMRSEPRERALDLRTLMDDLLQDQVIGSGDHMRVLNSSRSKDEALLHPLIYIAAQNLSDARREGRLDMAQLLHWLSKKTEQPIFHLDPLKVDVPAVTEVMSFEFAQRHHILAVDVSADEVTIASAEPNVSSWQSNLEHVLRRPIKRVLIDPVDLKRYTVEFYSLAKSVRGAAGTAGGGSSLSSVTNFEQLLELGEMKDPDANDQHIVNIVDWILQYAFDQRASDIHIEPRREVGNVRFRIDGVLYTVSEFPAQVAMAITSRLKILGRLNVAEKRKPQDGRLKTVSPEGNEIELRLSTMPTAFGEKLVMRIFDPDVLLRSFEQLGLANEDYSRWQNMIDRPNGIVLVTGPTGSGKTTTLYSSLKKIATSEVNVCTIEDPIEMMEDSFNQMQVQHNIDLDFASGVRALMRQDPDIIMIGEIRDLETAEMAIQAALTGHLVLSTLHTNDAPSAITRMLELGVPSYLLKATILGVMAQRLVRTLCPHCKQPDTVSQEDWNTLTKPWKVTLPKTIFQPKGCLECRDTGYLGRQGIYEIMVMSESVQDNIHEQLNLEQIRRQSMKEGMRTLRLSGAQKVAAGDTTIAEVLRVSPAQK